MTATDTTTPSQQGETSPAATEIPDPDEQEKIDKAIKFWTHHSLQNVSSEEKRAFLHGQGLNDAHIHKAWEKMINEESDVVVGQAAKQTKQGHPSYETAPAAMQNAMPPNGGANQQQQRYSRHQQPPQPYGSYPPHQYPQQSPSHYPNNFMNDHEEEGPISVAKGVSLVAVGGFLGLTAAAAVRWLNGGDFELLPPPVDGSIQQQQQTEQEMADDEYYDGVDYADDEEDGNYDYDGDEDDDEEFVDTLEVQQRLFEKMEELSQTVAANTSTQEKLMIKISSSASTVTNQSMNLLRKSQASSKAQNDLDVSSLSQLLTEVQNELSAYTEAAAETANGNRQELQDESTKLGEKLQKCLNMLKQAADTSEDDKDLFASPTKSTSQSSPESSTSLPTRTPTKSPRSENASQSSSLHDCIRQIAEGNDASTLKVGTQLLYLYLVNLSGKPENARYRKIYTSNQSFQKVESLVGGKELLQAVGFVEDKDKSLLEWIPSGDSVQETAALVQVKEAASALSILKSGKPGEELTEPALSKIVLLQDVFVDATDEEPTTKEVVDAVVSPPPPPPPPTVDEAPQTPAGSMLVSPPMTKKLPFPEQPSATPTNLSDRLDKLPMDEGDDEEE